MGENPVCAAPPRSLTGGVESGLPLASTGNRAVTVYSAHFVCARRTRAMAWACAHSGRSRFSVGGIGDAGGWGGRLPFLAAGTGRWHRQGGTPGSELIFRQEAGPRAAGSACPWALRGTAAPSAGLVLLFVAQDQIAPSLLPGYASSQRAHAHPAWSDGGRHVHCGASLSVDGRLELHTALYQALAGERLPVRVRGHGLR